MDGIYNDDEWWKENFRMSQGTYHLLCNDLNNHIQRQFTRFRPPISVNARVAITIWRLSTNSDCRTIATLFGVGRSTVYEILSDTCDAITSHLMKRYVHIPNFEVLQKIVFKFEQHWGFPQAIAAIDGSHIPIIKPLQCPSDYYNRKGYYSILIQALVDSHGLFMDVNIGWLGKVHDARVFANSSCFYKGNANALFPQWLQNINGITVPLLILGDSAYPLLPWLMKPYLENEHTTSQEHAFNYRQSRARMVVENAFGRLKGRWRCLMKRIDIHTIPDVINIIAACIVLHNYHEVHDNLNIQEWIDDVQPHHEHHIVAMNSTAKQIRDAIKDSFF